VTPQAREALRWSVSFVAVVAVHVGGAAALLTWQIPQDLPAAPPAVMLELAPLATAPSTEETETPPDEKKQEAADPPPPDPRIVEDMLPDPEPPEPVKMPDPVDLAELLPPPEVPPEVVIEVPPKPEPPKPKPKPKPIAKPKPRKPDPVRKPPAEQTTAPAAAPVPQAQAAAAPPPGSAARPSPDVVRRWQAMLVAHLQRHKRYPSAARRDSEEGVAYLRFVMDRNGNVLSKRLERASGHRALDQETLDLIDRAQPLPKPPADMPGERFEFTVPVQFHLH
jgi:protein TonB